MNETCGRCGKLILEPEIAYGYFGPICVCGYPAKNLNMQQRLEQQQKEMTMNRFDYVEYDQLATADQKHFKAKFMELEQAVNQHDNGRAKALALTALEEAYMWIGKMIRDEQVNRNGSAPLQEQRINS